MRFISLLVILVCTLAFALASPSSHELGRNVQEAREAAGEVGARVPTSAWKRDAEPVGSAWKREPTPPGWKRGGGGGAAWKRNNKNRAAPW